AAISSAAGFVVYRTGAPSHQQLTWFDRTGKTLGTLAALNEVGLQGIRISSDGRRVAVTRNVLGNDDGYLLDGIRSTRFTFDAATDRLPIWSPDGSRIVFQSNRKGARNLYLKPSSGASGEELLFESSQDKTASDWSPDGRFILFNSVDPQSDQDMWVLP